MSERFTLVDWERLPEGFPAQLVGGFLVKEPSPDYEHQCLASMLHVTLAGLVGARRALPSPLDVVLGPHDVYQPDLVVLREVPPPGTRRVGIPLLAIEILSPPTARRDRGIKRRRLLRAGVEEVWILDRDARRIEVYEPAGMRVASEGDRIACRALPGFALVPAELFAQPGAA